jgi:hypothetical protein
VVSVPVGQLLHRLGAEATQQRRYIPRLARYIPQLTDEYNGHIFISFLYLHRFGYREIYLSYIPRFRGIKKYQEMYIIFF